MKISCSGGSSILLHLVKAKRKQCELRNFFLIACAILRMHSPKQKRKTSFFLFLFVLCFE